jgi:hypothetical protein
MSAEPVATTAPELHDALDRLVSLSVEDLRRLAVRLDSEQRVVKSLLRERARRPERAAGLSVLAEKDCTE